MSERNETKIPLRSGHDLIIGTREDQRPAYYVDLVCCVNAARQVELSRGNDWAETAANARDALTAILEAVEAGAGVIERD